MTRLATSALFCAMFLLGTNAVSAATYDPAVDFATGNNPSGTWTFGAAAAPGGSVTPFAELLYPYPDMMQRDVAAGQLPGMFLNTGSTPMTVYTSVDLEPGLLTLHPGPTGQYSVALWTAPTAGLLNMNIQFLGVDITGTTTDVHVLHNSTELHQGPVNGYYVGPSWTDAFQVHAGDTIALAVGYGSNGSYYYDSTGLRATLTLSPVIPEPISAGLGTMGLLTLGLWLFRRPKNCVAPTRA